MRGEERRGKRGRKSYVRFSESESGVWNRFEGITKRGRSSGYRYIRGGKFMRNEWVFKYGFK